ncbi:MAG: hypothetical protein ACRECG_09785, partial [Bradyrhizobium sp.]
TKWLIVWSWSGKSLSLIAVQLSDVRPVSQGLSAYMVNAAIGLQHGAAMSWASAMGPLGRRRAGLGSFDDMMALATPSPSVNPGHVRQSIAILVARAGNPARSAVARGSVISQSRAPGHALNTGGRECKLT